MPWLMLGGVLAGGALLGWWLPREALEWNAALVAGQPWRLLTAAWAHLDAAHLLTNVAAAAVVTAYGRLAGCGLRDALAWLAAWPVTHALLGLQPDLQRYAGLSGVLHAGVAVACMALLTRSQGQPRLIGGAVMVGLLVKLVLESPLSAPVQVSPEWSFPVAVLAHATGAIAGLACSLVAWVTSPHPPKTTIR